MQSEDYCMDDKNIHQVKQENSFYYKNVHYFKSFKQTPAAETMSLVIIFIQQRPTKKSYPILGSHFTSVCVYML